MTDTAARIYGPALLTNASATLFTVPGSTTCIVRHIRVVNTSASAATLFLTIGADAAGTRLESGILIGANDGYDWSGFLVLAAAETFRGYSGTNNVLTISVSGVNVT